ncbi:TPA: helix-turn-helix domain-containing protein [Serratia fonticola]
MPSDYAKKLKQIRFAEGLTQQAFSELTGIVVGTIKNYETGRVEAGLKTIELVVNNPALKKYTLWLMIGSVAPEIGKISPIVLQAGKRTACAECSEKDA